MTEAGASPRRPPRLVVMGVAGSGKTTIGRELAVALGLAFVDADDLHPAANVAKMAAGIPLSEADRAPWLAAVTGVLAAADEGVVLACSALRRAHRDALRRAGHVEFVFLDVDQAEATTRAATRPDHFMGPEMIPSQFAALERPNASETDVVTVDAAQLASDVVASIERSISRRPGRPRSPG